MARHEGKTPLEIYALDRSRLAVLAAVFVGALLALGSIQASTAHLVGVDGYYHTRVAAIVAERGFIDSFPWTQASLYRDTYADTEVLFHLLLVPFLGEGLVLGPKILTVLLGALVVGLLAFIVLRHQMPWPWIWPVLLLSAGAPFTLRLCLTRPHLLSLVLVLLFLYAVLRRSVPALFVLATIYPLAYTAAHLFPGIIVVFLAAHLVMREKAPFRLLWPVLAGTLLGIVLHPNLAHWPQVWWAINVGDLTNADALAEQIATEFQAGFGTGHVWTLGLLLPLLFLGPLAAHLQRRRLSLRTVFLLMLTAVFFVLFLRHQRFLEYFVPFAVLSAASLARDTEGFGLPLVALAYPRWVRALTLLFVVGLLGQGANNLIQSQKVVAVMGEPRFESAAEWIAAHVPEGETVFTRTWDSTPHLIHHAPNARYLNALSPNLMFFWDEGLFELWRRIGRGEEPGAVDLTASRFGARWILVERDPSDVAFYAQARADPRLDLRYEDLEAAIFTWR